MSDQVPRQVQRSPRRASRAALALVLALAAGLLAACGSGGGTSGSDAPDYDAAIAKAPPKLAGLYADGDAVIAGGQAAYERKLRSVRGYPVVVNNWASWCMPCRDEFPHFQALSARYLDRVAFLGVDSEDSTDAAETFLRDNPLPYPSVAAPEKQDLQQWTGTTLVGYPNTLFYDRQGKLLYAKQGPYTSESDLRADLQKYALSNG